MPLQRSGFSKSCYYVFNYSIQLSLYDMKRDAILTSDQKPTWGRLIYSKEGRNILQHQFQNDDWAEARKWNSQNQTPTFTRRSLRAFADCNSFTSSSSPLSLLFPVLFRRDNSRSVLHFASITDFELFTFLHRIFAMTLAMPVAGNVLSPSPCNELAVSSVCSPSVS